MMPVSLGRLYWQRENRKNYASEYETEIADLTAIKKIFECLGLQVSEELNSGKPELLLNKGK